MSIRRRLITVLGLAPLAAAFTGVPAAADGFPIPTGTGGPNQLILASTTADNSWLVRTGTQVAIFGGDSWTSANIASATSAVCTGCHTTAVAVQVTLVTGSPSVATPGNAAVAVNAACNGCGSYAYAWQYWVFTSRPVQLSSSTVQEVAALRAEIADTAASILPSDRLTDPCFTEPPFPCTPRNLELDEALDRLTARLKEVIDNDVKAAGVTATGSIARDVQQAPGS